jgi:hypothetical protein
VTINVHVVLLMTTDIERKIRFDVEGLGSYLISIKLVGELSTKLDPDDIDMLQPPIGSHTPHTTRHDTTRHATRHDTTRHDTQHDATRNTTRHDAHTTHTTRTAEIFPKCYYRPGLVRHGVQGQLPRAGGGGQAAQLPNGQAPHR